MLFTRIVLWLRRFFRLDEQPDFEYSYTDICGCYRFDGVGHIIRWLEKHKYLDIRRRDLLDSFGVLHYETVPSLTRAIVRLTEYVEAQVRLPDEFWRAYPSEAENRCIEEILPGSGHTLQIRELVECADKLHTALFKEGSSMPASYYTSRASAVVNDTLTILKVLSTVVQEREVNQG